VRSSRAIADLAARCSVEREWGTTGGAADAHQFVRTFRDPVFVASLATARTTPSRWYFELVQDTFRRFAEEKIRPIAEHPSRNADIPGHHRGLAEMAASAAYRLPRVRRILHGGGPRCLGIGRDEELSRIARRRRVVDHSSGIYLRLLAGGTEEQKQGGCRWRRPRPWW
jgi:(2S)-methylsuccinyl-CoA dehydrogenase